MFFIFQGQPGNEGRRGEAGIPGCNGTKVRTHAGHTFIACS